MRLTKLHTPRFIAQLVGKLCSTQFVFKDTFCQLSPVTTELAKATATNSSWDVSHKFSAESVAVLTRLAAIVDTPTQSRLPAQSVSWVLDTDATCLAWGGRLTVPGRVGRPIRFGSTYRMEQPCSSVGELRALHCILPLLPKECDNSAGVWIGDNVSSLVAVVKCRTASDDMRPYLIDLIRQLGEKGITLHHAEWIASKENVVPDAISRTKLKPSTLPPPTLAKLRHWCHNNGLPKPTLDMWGFEGAHACPSFFAPFLCEDASGESFFAEIGPAVPFFCAPAGVRVKLFLRCIAAKCTCFYCVDEDGLSKITVMAREQALNTNTFHIRRSEVPDALKCESPDNWCVRCFTV